MSKIPKEAVLYILRPETQYTCDKCINYHEGRNEKDICALFGKGDPIADYGSCGFFVHGPTETNPIVGLITKLQAGYFENKQGFSCKRCEYFLADTRDCRKVDKDSEGDTPAEIHPNACCNAWEGDPTRAKKTTEALLDGDSVKRIWAKAKDKDTKGT